MQYFMHAVDSFAVRPRRRVSKAMILERSRQELSRGDLARSEAMLSEFDVEASVVCNNKT